MTDAFEDAEHAIRREGAQPWVTAYGLDDMEPGDDVVFTTPTGLEIHLKRRDGRPDHKAAEYEMLRMFDEIYATEARAREENPGCLAVVWFLLKEIYRHNFPG